VGRVFSPEELARMADICRKHKVIIFSDEIHADLVFTPHHHIPIATLAEDITLTGISPAKSFNIAGMGTAVLISQNPDLIKPVEKLNFALHTYMGNSMGIVAFTAAYGESEAWPNILPSVKISPIEGTYLAWLDFREYGLPEDELMRILRDDCRLALNQGSTFGDEGLGFMRMHFGCPRSILEEALTRLQKFPKE
jgi:cysteine-S-conjugate beta-lyase